MRCDLSRLLSRKITKRTHSSKPASLNRPIAATFGHGWVNVAVLDWVVSRFLVFSLNQTERLVQLFVQSNILFGVMGQETCEKLHSVLRCNKSTRRYVRSCYYQRLRQWLWTTNLLQVTSVLDGNGGLLIWGIRNLGWVLLVFFSDFTNIYICG